MSLAHAEQRRPAVELRRPGSSMALVLAPASPAPAPDVTALAHARTRLYSGHESGLVKIWTEDFKLIKEISAHPSNIYSLAVAPPSANSSTGTLYTSSNDGTIKAWCAETGEFKKDLISYENEVETLFVYKGILYAGDDKGSVGVFIDDKLKLIFNLLEEVKDLIVNDNLMYTVRDLDVIITEFMSEESTRYMTRQTLVGKAPMCLSGDKLCFASRCGKKILCHHNSKDDQFKLLDEIEAHNMIINAMRSYANSDGSVTLYTGGWDKILKIWNINESGKIELKNSLDTKVCINTICVGDDGQVFVGGSDGFLCRVDL